MYGVAGMVADSGLWAGGLSSRVKAGILAYITVVRWHTDEEGLS